MAHGRRPETAPANDPGIVIAHPFYRLGDAYRRLRPDAITEVRTSADLIPLLPTARVLVISRLWQDAFLDLAPHLTLIQSISAGVDQFDVARIARRGIRLTSAQGANETAVAEHAIALMLGLTRQIHHARDCQNRRIWREPSSAPESREEEVSDKTVAIVGFGRIGRRVAAIARALGMKVIGVQRRPNGTADCADRLVSADRLNEALAAADIVVLTCPHTAETDGLIGRAQFAAMKPTAYLVNVARGRVVDHAALISALESGRLAGAALDCFVDEPLPADSPLWAMPHVMLTPHSAGNTRNYEANVAEILAENVARLERGTMQLLNQIS